MYHCVKRNRIVAIVIAAAVVLIAVLCILLTRMVAVKNAKLVQGTWAYGNEVTYSFDGKKNGQFVMEDMHFDYTYKVSKGQLKMNYKDETVVDATYQFTVEGNQLTLIGGEGTAGGTYQLTRVD